MNSPRTRSTKIRGPGDFDTLWNRRTIVRTDDGTEINVMSLPDLVKTKKTQRDKACPMIRRLLEADYFANRDHPSVEQLKFWMLELRTPQLLIEVVASNRELAGSLEDSRPLLRLAAKADERSLAESLLQEELHIREKDREYWRPLKAELEKLRLDRPRP